MVKVPNTMRINVDLDRELYKRWIKCFPWGTRSEAIRSLIELGCASVENGGAVMLGAILSKELSLNYNPKDSVEKFNGAR